MTQTANRAPRQAATITQGASGGGAGRGAPANTNIVPLSVHRGDVCGSLLGTMLFPSDTTKADSCSAQLLTKGPLQDYLRAGHTFSLTREISLLDALGREISSKEIETQKLHGFRAGEVVKVLWALICSRPDASWDSAIWVVEDAWAGEGHRAGRATFRADLSEMRAVLHLWGALALRDYQLLADPNVGYDGLDDLAAFMSEAMALRQQLCLWRDGRNTSDTLLAGDAFGPWIGWQAHEPRPGWPDTGRLHAVSLPPSVRVPVRLPPGRPPKKEKPRPVKI